MNPFIKILLFSLLTASFALSAFADDFKVKTFNDGKMTLKWKLEGANIHIIFGAKNQGKGWVGLGFNDKKVMTDGDFVVGFVKGAKGEVVEHFGKGPSKHDEKPGKGDLISSKVYVEGDMTMIEFVRPLKGSNPKSKPLVANGENKMMLSFADAPRFSKKHEIKDVVFFSINFTTGDVKNL